MGLSLHDLWSKTKHPLGERHNLDAFGCLAGVSWKWLLDGMSIPGWERQSGQGMHIGMSDKHVRSVPMVLNFERGNITTKCNAVSDNWWFSMVATSTDDISDFHAKMTVRLTHNWMTKSKNLQKDQLKQLDLTSKAMHLVRRKH